MQGLSVYLKRQNGRLLSQLVLTQYTQETTAGNLTFSFFLKDVGPVMEGGNALYYLLCFPSQGRTSLACW